MKTCTTVPVVVSTSAVASRTCMPVILLILLHSDVEAVVKSRRWNSCTWAAPAGHAAKAFSAAVKAACKVITIVSAFRRTATHLWRWPVRLCSKRLASRAICSVMVKSAFSINNSLLPTPFRCCKQNKKADAIEHPQGFDHVGVLVNGPTGSAGLPFI